MNIVGIRYWDADRFEQIQILPGHLLGSSVWGLDVSSDGSYCVSCGQDRTIRTWRRGEDLVFIEEEKDRALEAQVDLSAMKTAGIETSSEETPSALDPASLKVGAH